MASHHRIVTPLEAPYEKSEYSEAWDRVREYVKYRWRRRKSTRTQLQEDILRSYEEVLWNWTEEKSRPVRVFVRLCVRLIRVLGPLLFP